MTWVQTHSGRAFDLRLPAMKAIDIVDIAIALSRESRYNGHTLGDEPYSVAQHSVYAARCAPKELKAWALLHDASEAYIKDLPHPVKEVLPDYKRLEEVIMFRIAARFKLPWPCPPEIKEIDNRLLATERKWLMSKCNREWEPMAEPYDFHIEPWHHNRAREEFLNAWSRIRSDDDG